MSTLRRTAALGPLAALALLLTLTGCGGGDEHASDPTTPTTSATATSSATAGSGRTFAPTDYRYRLRVLCYCPLVGPVDVEVSGGKVTAATVATGPQKGRPAPAYTRKTISDLLALDRAEVVWPKGAQAPSRVTVDQLRRASDARITYVISRVVTR